MERFYDIAGTVIRVSCQDQQMYCEDGVLSPFVTENQSWNHSLDMEIVEQLSDPRGELVFADPSKKVYRTDDAELRYIGAVERSAKEGYMRICRQGNHSHVQIKRNPRVHTITPKSVLNAMEAEHFIVQNRGFVLHASYIKYNDKAILFTAPSGTGKSTQADLWCRYRGAELINGDQAAVMLRPEGVFAEGIPFSGSSGVCKNEKLPLAAIVYLSQASKTTIAPLTGLRAFRRIWEGCSINTWNRVDVDICTQTVISVLSELPVFYLACTPDESAITALEESMKQQR